MGEVPIDAEFLMKLGKDMGETSQAVKTIKSDIVEIKTQQKKLATKKDVNSKVEAAIGEHEQIHHPSKAEVIGEKVLRLKDMTFGEFRKAYPKLAISILSSPIIVILGLLWKLFTGGS